MKDKKSHGQATSPRLFRLFSITTASSWLFLFAFVPLLMAFCISFLSPDNQHFFRLPVTLSNYFAVFNPLFANIMWRSLWMAAITTFICLLLAYPFAYILAQSRAIYKPLFICLMIIPFWTSSVIRIYAIIALIKARGLLNALLLHLGLIHQPLQLLFTHTAVFIGLVYNLLPYMILPIYTSIEKLDSNMIEAARDLGASNLRIFRQIMIPSTLPGIITGIILVCLPAMTLFYIPDLLGGARSILLGNLISTQMLTLRNWPLGCATSVMLTVIMLAILSFSHRAKQRQVRKSR